MHKLRLTVTYTHAGCEYQAGDIIEADDVIARLLVELGVCQPITAELVPEIVATETEVLLKTRSQHQASDDEQCSGH
jgi:hypothetical protein